MNSKFSIAIMNRLRAKDKYRKWPYRENFLELKIIKNLCKILTKKAKKSYLNSVSSKDMTSNKPFWNGVKLFFQTKILVRMILLQ